VSVLNQTTQVKLSLTFFMFSCNSQGILKKHLKSTTILDADIELPRREIEFLLWLSFAGTS